MRSPAAHGRMAMLVAFAGTSVINYGFGVASGWLLTPGDFGLLAFTQTVLLIGGLVLNGGFALGLSAVLAKNEAPDHAQFMRGTLAANIAIALGLSAILMLGFALGPLRQGFEHGRVLLLVVAALPLFALLAIAKAAAQGGERFGIVAVLQIVEVGGKAGVGLALAWWGYGATGTVAGFTIGALAAAVLALVLLVRTLGMPLWGHMRVPALRPVLGMFGALLGMALLLNMDIVALKLGTSDRAVIGQYQAAIVLANAPYYLAAAVLPVFFVQMARCATLAATAPVVGDALRLALVCLVPIQIALALAPETFLQLLFPAAYGQGAAVLPILAWGNCAMIFAAIMVAAFQATNRAGTPARLILAVIAAEALVFAMLLSALQAVGAATIFGVAATSACSLLAIAYGRALDRPVLAQGWCWLWRYGLVLAASGGVAWVALRAMPSWTALLVGGLCYVIGALWSGLVRIPAPLIRHNARASTMNK